KTENSRWNSAWLSVTEALRRHRESRRPARTTQTRTESANGTTSPQAVGMEPPPRMWEVRATKVAVVAAAPPRRTRRCLSPAFTCPFSHRRRGLGEARDVRWWPGSAGYPVCRSLVQQALDVGGGDDLAEALPLVHERREQFGLLLLQGQDLLL